MSKYGEEPSGDLSCLGGEEFQVALRVALNDLKDQENIFAEFLGEAGDPDKHNWKRPVQYSHLHLLFARTIVRTLLAEGDRRTESQRQNCAATCATMRPAQDRLQKSTSADETVAPLLDFLDRQRISLDCHSQRSHARIHREHEVGFAIRGPSFIKRSHIVDSGPVATDGADFVEPHFRWVRAVHWEFRARLIRAASAQR